MDQHLRLGLVGIKTKTVISQIWDLIETWRFHVYDPYDLPDNSISPPDKFIKPNPNSLSSRKAEKFKFEIDRKIVDRQTDRPKDRVIPTIRWLWIKSTSLKLYPRPTLFSVIKSLFPNRFMTAISGITESAHKSNPHTI